MLTKIEKNVDFIWEKFKLNNQNNECDIDKH